MAITLGLSLAVGSTLGGQALPPDELREKYPGRSHAPWGVCRCGGRSVPSRLPASRSFENLRGEMVVLHVRSAAPAPPPDGDEGTEFLYECPAASSVADVAAALGALAGLQARLLSLCRCLRARCADARDAGELERALDEAEAYASKEQAQRNRFLSPRALREHIKNIEKKCATALQEPPEALSLQESPSDSKHERIQLWWAGKELAMDQKLCDYIGVNDKTKIVVRLMKSCDKR